MLGLGLGLNHVRSRGPAFGPELVPNSTFDANITGWGNHGSLPPDIIQWSAGRLRISNDGSSRGLCGQTAGMAVTAGKTYAYSIDVQIVGPNAGPSIGINLFAYATARASINSSGVPGSFTFAGSFVAPATESVHFIMDFNSGVAQECYFDNVSLKEVL